MNHFIGLVILSICISAVFALITKEKREEQIRYFFTLLGYLVLGSFVAAWIMWLVP